MSSSFLHKFQILAIYCNKETTKMKVSGLEANLLLFALDKYLGVDRHGKLLFTQRGYTMEETQDLRDRLFAAHEHPEEDIDG